MTKKNSFAPASGMILVLAICSALIRANFWGNASAQLTATPQAPQGIPGGVTTINGPAAGVPAPGTVQPGFPARANYVPPNAVAGTAQPPVVNGPIGIPPPAPGQVGNPVAIPATTVLPSGIATPSMPAAAAATATAAAAAANANANANNLPAPATPVAAPVFVPAPVPAAAVPAPASAPSPARNAHTTLREDSIVRPGTGTSIVIQTETKNGSAEGGVRATIQDFAGFRDPFKSPELQTTAAGAVSPLEKYILTEYKLTGVMTGPRRMRAMIQAPDGKSHFVSEGMKLGNRGGIIKRITTKSVIVTERSVNALGEEEFTRSEISISPDTNLAAGATSSPPLGTK